MIYLDNAATGRFKPECVFAAMARQLRFAANPGRSGHFASLYAAKKVEEARENLKKLFFAPEDAQLIFTCNCTEALNYAILGWLQDKSGSVVCTAFDHNSVLRPLNALKKRGLEVKVVFPRKSGELAAADIAAAISEDTRLVVVTHASNVTGRVVNVEAVGRECERRGVPLLLDCAQSVGHYEINMQKSKAAFICCAGHKGLHAPQGSGFLIVRAGLELKPLKFGGTGTNSLSLEMPALLPEALEAGTLNTPAIDGLNAGAQWTHERFLEINAAIGGFCALLRGRLEKCARLTIYSPEGSHLFAFALEGIASTDVADALSENGIAVRGGLHCAPLMHAALGTLDDGLVRISPGADNTLEQAERTARAIMRIAGSAV